MNFDNLVVRLHVFIIFFILAKFQKDQRLTAMSSIKRIISSLCGLKLCIKNKFVDKIVNDI